MKPGLPLLVTLIALLGLAVLPGCAATEPAQENVVTESLEDGNENLMVNRIAFIDNSGDLFLINSDATDEERLTGDVRAGVLAQALERGDSYSWPTWSHDGSRLAASRVVLSGQGGGLSVQVFDLSSGRMISAYENEVPAPVADGAAHYLYWSPDDRYLTFLAPTPDGLALFVRDYQSGDDAASVVVGAPIYYHWAADSGALAVHGGDRVTMQEPSPDGAETRLAVDAVGFRAPAISPDGSQVAYAGIGGGVQGIFLAPTGSGAAQSPTLLMETRGLTAFAWASDGSALAVAEQVRAGSPLFDRLVLVPADGTAPSTLAEEQFLAFFWSPTGERIAWIGISPQSREMELVVSRTASGEDVGENAAEPRRLFRFSPTGEFFTMLSFFDQYAYSHSIWSPDGDALVVTGNEGPESGRRNGSGPPGGQVYVVDVSSGDARRIASGKVAVWSWN